MKGKARSVEKHNKFSERVFAYFDNLLRYKPRINILASEAYMTFAVNKATEWFKDKPDDEAEVLVASSRKEIEDLCQNLKQRLAIIVNRTRDKIEEDRH